jgi:hypothetical protein
MFLPGKNTIQTQHFRHLLGATRKLDEQRIEDVGATLARKV